MSVPTTTELKGIMKWFGSNILSLETVLGQFLKWGSPMMYCKFEDIPDMTYGPCESTSLQQKQQDKCILDVIVLLQQRAPMILLGLWVPLWDLHGQFFPLNIINTAWDNCYINYHHHSGTVADQRHESFFARPWTCEVQMLCISGSSSSVKKKGHIL